MGINKMPRLTSIKMALNTSVTGAKTNKKQALLMASNLNVLDTHIWEKLVGSELKMHHCPMVHFFHFQHEISFKRVSRV